MKQAVKCVFKMYFLGLNMFFKICSNALKHVVYAVKLWFFLFLETTDVLDGYI